MRRHLLSAFAAAALSCGCNQQKAAAPKAVAEVAGNAISAETFQAVLNARSAGDTNRYASLSAKQGLLDELIVQESVYAKAKAAGFDKRADIQESVKRMIVARFQEEQMAGKLERQIADAEVKEYYDANPAQFTAPAEVRGAVIFMRISQHAEADKRAEITGRAQEILEEAKRGKDSDFPLLVMRHSEDQATRYQGGDLGWIGGESKPWGIDKAIVDALSGLDKAGDFAPLVVTPKGVYIVKLTGKRAAALRPLAEVKERIRYILARHNRETRAEEFGAAMKANLEIHVNDALLEAMKAAPVRRDDARPPAMQTSLVTPSRLATAEPHLPKS
jgi:parvulin-like peptidyl-prolyl isomerase